MKYIFKLVCLITGVLGTYGASAKLPVSNLTKKGIIQINVFYSNYKPGDTLSVTIGNLPFIEILPTEPTASAALNKQGYFKFIIPIKMEMGYFALTKPRASQRALTGQVTLLMNHQFWQVGDSITLHLESDDNFGLATYKCAFKGRGSEKYQVAEELRTLKQTSNTPISINDIDVYFKGDIIKYKNFDKLTQLDLTKLSKLALHKKELDSFSYNLIKANILFSNKATELSYLKSFFRDSVLTGRKYSATPFRERYGTAYSDIMLTNIPDEVLEYSPSYLQVIYKKMQNDVFIMSGNAATDHVYEQIKKELQGNVRDKILLTYFLRLKQTERSILLYHDALKIVKDEECLALLEEILLRAPGRDFLNFSLEDLNGNQITLASFRNKIVFLDFWFTNCGHCEEYYRDVLSKAEKAFEDSKDVVFVSISIDKNKYSWKKSVLANKYTSNAAVNLYTNGLGHNADVIKANKITGYPCVVLLDRDGKIVYYNSSNLYDPESLINELSKLQRK